MHSISRKDPLIKKFMTDGIMIKVLPYFSAFLTYINIKIYIGAKEYGQLK